MIKNLLVITFCLGLTGCAAIQRAEFNQKYLEIYDNGLNANEVTSISKRASFSELKQELAKYITMHGYYKVILDDPMHGFVVFAKEASDHSSIIIFKFTVKADGYKTSLDLVKGSNDPSTNSAVNEDIKEIASQINDE